MIYDEVVEELGDPFAPIERPELEGPGEPMIVEVDGAPGC